VSDFDRAVPPGGEGIITLKVDLRGYHGRVAKGATVFTNDPKSPRLALLIKGTVRPVIEVKPAPSVVFRGVAKALTEQSLDLISRSGPFHIQKVETDLGDRIEFRLETVTEGTHYRLVVANRASSGSYQGVLTCFTDHPQKPKIQVRVTGAIEGVIGIRPTNVLVGRLNAQSPPRSGSILIVNNEDRPFRITQLTFDDRLLSIRQQPLPEGQGYTLQVEPKLEHVPKGTQQHATLTLATDAEPDRRHQIDVFVVNR